MVRSSVGERVLPGVRFDLFPLKFSRAAHRLATGRKIFPRTTRNLVHPVPPVHPPLSPAAPLSCTALGARLATLVKLQAEHAAARSDWNPQSKRGTHPRPGPLSAMLPSPSPTRPSALRPSGGRGSDRPITPSKSCRLSDGVEPADFGRERSQQVPDGSLISGRDLR
jgi:hypothetical protein